MDRYWFLTWTTYGTWLPGDRRGFVGPVRDEQGQQTIHNVPGTPYDADQPPLQAYAHSALKCPPILLGLEHAHALLGQFQETAQYRRWQLLAVAIMANHTHLVVGVPGDPDPSDLLQDFKAYGSRALNRCWGKPVSNTWWTESGSKRKLRDEQAIREVVNYVARRQPHPLLVWTAEGW